MIAVECVGPAAGPRVLFWASGFGWNFWQIRKAYRQHVEWRYDFPYQVAVALGLAVLLLLFEGIGGHNLFRYSWLWYGGFLIIARHCVEQRLACAWGKVPRFTPRPTWAHPRPALGRGVV